MTFHLLGRPIWGHIWKHTKEKSHPNATFATMHPPNQAIWGHIWKPTMEKSQINEINETLHPTLHPLMQEVYGDKSMYWIKGVSPIASWFCFIQILKPPLVNGRFPLQLNIELSTGRLQISASTEHSYPLLVFVELAFRHCLSLPGLNLRKIYIGSF